MGSQSHKIILSNSLQLTYPQVLTMQKFEISISVGQPKPKVNTLQQVATNLSVGQPKEEIEEDNWRLMAKR